ncbi:MAG: PAS domain S-box protein [Pseudomonadota bacterium]
MKKILIVDDNQESRYFLEILLKGHGFEIRSAENGQEALEMARAHPPDLIVSDILMPIMDGYTLCRQCKSEERLKNIPFVFYTATYTDPKDEKFALSLGADRFILKPQDPEILMNLLSELLEENYRGNLTSAKPLGEEMEFFRGHNEILFRKLEKKMLDLEIANKKLKVSEERYRLSFENVSDVIYTIDTGFKFSSISPSVERILGYKPEDFIGRSVTDLRNILTPESFERAIADISPILQGEIISGAIYEFVAKDGAIKFGEVSGSPIRRDGKIEGLISVARDITKRKKVEKALEEKEKQYRELYDFLPIPVYEMDLETNITSANRAIYETFGGTEEDLKNGFKAWQLLSPEEIEKSAKNIARLLKGEQVEGTEYTLMRLDGTLFPAIVISSVIFSDGKPVGLRGAIVDITERKQVEGVLKESENKYRLLAENVNDVIFVLDMNLNYTYISPSVKILRGYEAAEVLKTQQPFETLTPSSWDLAMSTLSEIMALEKSGRSEIPIFRTLQLEVVRKDGTTVWTEVKFSFIRDENQRPVGILGVTRDITERKKAEEDEKKSFAQLRKALGATVQAMAVTVETRDPYTAGHQRRVANLARAIASEMNCAADQIEGLRLASMIHDIGKISVPAEILSMPRKLTTIEFLLIKTHAQSGYDILKDIEFPWPIARIVLEHHERMDGSGYPNGLTGKSLLLESRVMAVADVVEAIASHRPYRPALGIDAALEEIEKNKGLLYDIEAAEACLRLFKEKGFKWG